MRITSLPSRTSTGHIDVVETHVSWLFFTADRVYKVKKPVSLGFLDFSTARARTEACRAEVALNRRLAPDVYEGVGIFNQPHDRHEPVVIMKRLPSERSLTALVATENENVEQHVRRVARTLAAFHRCAGRGPDIDAQCTPLSLTELWRTNLEQLRDSSTGLLDGREIDRAGFLGERYMRGRADLFRMRMASGHAVDGHGDLLASDIFCMDEGPLILDCLEFDSALRYTDTLSDIAFLAMDLERLSRPDLSAVLLEEYRLASSDDWPATLEHFYIAYRALVRAKVACLTVSDANRSDGGGHDASDARLLLSLALQHLEQATVRLVLVGGLPGSGKSTLARNLSSVTGWPVRSSDELRKRLAGLEAADHRYADYGEGLYKPQLQADVYDELLREAEALLGLGSSVILDASWSQSCWREAAAKVVEMSAARVDAICCGVPSDLADSRITRRISTGSSASDATPSIARTMAAATEPWLDASPVDTSGQPGETLLAALELLDHDAEPTGPSVT